MRLKLFFITLLLISFSPSTFFPQDKDSILADFYFNKGKSYETKELYAELNSQQKTDSSVKYYTAAIPLLKKTGQWNEVASLSRFIAKQKAGINRDECIQYIKDLIDTLLQHKQYKFVRATYLFMFSMLNKLSIDDGTSCLYKALSYSKDKEKVTIYKILGNKYVSLNKVDSAIYIYNAALSLQKKEGLVTSQLFTGLSNCYKINQQYDLALKYLDSAMLFSSNQILNHAAVYNNKGNVYNAMGEFDKALEYYEKAIKLQISTRMATSNSILPNYYNVAYILNSKGDFVKSNEYLEEGINLLNNNNLISSYYYRYYNLKFKNHLALNENEDARHYANLMNELLKENKADTSEIFSLFAMVCYNQEKYDSSLIYYKMADSFNSEFESFDIGNLYFKLRDYQQARYFYEKYRLLLSKKLKGDDHPVTALIFKKIGDTYFQEGKFDSAVINYSSALKIFGISSENSYENIHLLLEKDIDITAFECFWYLSKIHKLTFNKTNEDIELKKSHSGYMLASEMLNNFKLYLQSEKSKLFWSENTSTFFDEAISNALFLWNRSGNIYYADDAQRLIEMSKAHILKGSIHESSAKKISDIPDSLLNIEHNLTNRLHSLKFSKRKEVLNKIPDHKKLDFWENEIFNVQRDYSFLIKDFELNYPEYYRVKYESNTLSFSQIQAKLKDDQSLLQYYLGENELHIIVINKENIHSYSTMVDSIFHHEIEHFISLLRKGNFLRSKNKVEFINCAYYLYMLLIDPVKEYLSDKADLIIIPSGALLSIPFEALITEKNNSSFSTQKFLIRDYIISYGYSASLIFDPQYQKHFKSKDGFTGFAPQFNNIQGSNSAELSRLLYNKDEVMKIAALFQNHLKPAAIYTGDDATEENFRKILSSRYIHIATHSVANEENPDLSALYFSAAHPDSLNDNVLYSDEIFDIKLNSDLVVLSSCETGTGKIINGEGILALTRGFIYNGVPNLLFSLWEVSDKSTSTLMIEFYDNILDGKNYKIALRDSKLKMLTNEFTCFPDKWAAFILLGN